MLVEKFEVVPGFGGPTHRSVAVAGVEVRGDIHVLVATGGRAAALTCTGPTAGPKVPSALVDTQSESPFGSTSVPAVFSVFPHSACKRCL